MDLEDVLARKRENLEKLIRNEDEAIRREMLKYEEAEFYIRLQSECFNLYPVVAKALSLLIADDKRRSVFCSILKGHKLEKLAAFHNLTPEEAVREFCAIVRELRHKINEGAFTAKESVNIRLLQERNELRHKVRTYDAMCEKLQLANVNLLEQITQLRDDMEKIIKSEAADKAEKELAMRKEIKQVLPEDIEIESEPDTKFESEIEIKIEIEIEKEKDKHPKEQITKPPSHLFNIVRWIRWLKIVYSRL